MVVDIGRGRAIDGRWATVTVESTMIVSHWCGGGLEPGGDGLLTWSQQVSGCLDKWRVSGQVGSVCCSELYCGSILYW